jgi:maintenance of morphology protein 1
MLQNQFLILPSFIDRVEISQFSLGDKYPTIKSCRYCNDRAEIALEFNDNISIRVETQLLLNWPKPGIFNNIIN